MTGLKPWKYRGKPFLIPDTHEPGEQKGFGMGSKHGGSGPSSSPGGRGKRSAVKFWSVGRWAEGKVK